MFGSVATWKIHAPFASPSEQETFVRDLVRRGIGEARSHGVMDVFMGALAPNILHIVSLFETQDEADSATGWAKRFVTREYRDVVTVIDRPVGPAFELRQFVDMDATDVPAASATPEPLAAQFVTWRLAPTLHAPDQLASFLNMAWHESFPALRAVGLCDIISVQVRPDELLALRLFVPHSAEHPRFHAAIAGKEQRFLPHGVVKSVRMGLGWDTQLLLDYIP